MWSLFVFILIHELLSGARFLHTQDVLTLEGRAYLEKMQWDKTEMLFYLQEERRKNALSSSEARKELTMDGFIGSLEMMKDRQARVG